MAHHIFRHSLTTTTTTAAATARRTRRNPGMRIGQLRHKRRAAIICRTRNDFSLFNWDVSVTSVGGAGRDLALCSKVSARPDADISYLSRSNERVGDHTMAASGPKSNHLLLRPVLPFPPSASSFRSGAEQGAEQELVTALSRRLNSCRVMRRGAKKLYTINDVQICAIMSIS